jgi:hypothetical protein
MTYLHKESNRVEEVKLKKKSRPRGEGLSSLCKRPKVRCKRAGVDELSLKRRTASLRRNEWSARAGVKFQIIRV